MTKFKNQIAIIGDVHADDKRLEAILNFLATQNTDQVICVGDIVDGEGSADRCIALLKEHHATTLLGNHDAWCLNDENRGVHGATLRVDLTADSLEFLASLPRTINLETAVGSAMICHGIRENFMAGIRPTDSMENITSNLDLWAAYKTPDLKYILNGHTHRPGVYQFNHLTIINAGSFYPKDIACAVLVDFGSGEVTFYACDESLHVTVEESKQITISQ